MIIDTESNEMQWILTKFLRDSLEFLADDERARGMQRKKWINIWREMHLKSEDLKMWMPKDGN